ncbi:MAG: DUF790 family protein, partial [Acidobacteriota bacterium]
HDDGTRVYLEMFGYWRRGAVERRLKLLRRHGPGNVLVALSANLAAGEETADAVADAVPLYRFRRTPLAGPLTKALEPFRQ